MIIDYIVEIGLDAIKNKALTAKQQQDIRKLLEQFIERQEQINISCTREEEIDFEGLAIYIRTNLLEDVQVLLFGGQKERAIRQETVITSAEKDRKGKDGGRNWRRKMGDGANYA